MTTFYFCHTTLQTLFPLLTSLLQYSILLPFSLSPFFLTFFSFFHLLFTYLLEKRTPKTHHKEKRDSIQFLWQNNGNERKYSEVRSFDGGFPGWTFTRPGLPTDWLILGYKTKLPKPSPGLSTKFLYAFFSCS